MSDKSDEAGVDKNCDRCGLNTAVVHVTQVVNNEVTTSHLCEVCAAEKGLQPEGLPANLPLADFLAKMGGDDPSSSTEDDEDLVCPFCELSARDFKEGGRLGCPQCYSTFEPHLRGLLRRVHGGTAHVGKVYLPPDPTVSEREKRLDALRKKLQRAVDAEDFERAAELRDEIRALEPVL